MLWDQRMALMPYMALASGRPGKIAIPLFAERESNRTEHHQEDR